MLRLVISAVTEFYQPGKLSNKVKSSSKATNDRGNGQPKCANARYIHTTVDGQFDIHLVQRYFSITDRLAKGTYRSYHKSVSGSLSNGGDDGGNKNIANNEFASFQTLSCPFEPAQFV